MLYPVCEDANRVPVCIKDAQYLGVVRTSVYVLLPLVISLTLVLVFNECAKSLQNRQRNKLTAKLGDDA